jgi:hypothetical protein
MAYNLREAKYWARHYLKGADSYLEGVRLHAGGGDPHAVRQCLSYAGLGFECLLKAGVIQWRFELEKPVKVLRRALDLAARVLPQARQFAAQPGMQPPVSYPTAGFFHVLLDGTVPDEIQALWPKGKLISGFYSLNTPDSLLLRALTAGRKPPAWDAVIKDLPSYKEKHFAECYPVYLGVALHGLKGEWPEALEHARAAEALYRKRARMHTISDLNGGYSGNDMFLDYRLAAILKHASHGKKRPLAGFDSIHLWRWK